MANPPVLKQSAARSICRYESRKATVTFNDPTIDRNLVVVTAVLGGGGPAPLQIDAGFAVIRNLYVGALQAAMWYYEGAPSMQQVTVTSGYDRSLQVRAFEYRNAAQSNCLDKVSVFTRQDDYCDTGSSGTTNQADTVVLALIANRHASTTQTGFIGGLARLFEAVSPQYYGLFGSNNDEERSRCSHHELVAAAIASFRLACRLSSRRDWIAILATFKGGTSGPKRMTSKDPANISTVTTGGSGVLSAFGKFTSVSQPAIFTSYSGSGRILPFEFQFLMNGLLLGQDTLYDVVSHDGLYGYQMRTSDDDQPRGDGALRGVDLQSARNVLLKLQLGGSEAEAEQLLAVLYASARPQRDVDFEFVWRHPASAARMIRCRPIDVPREATHDRTYLFDQSIQLRAVDPRHYSAVARQVIVPVTPAGGQPLTVVAHNSGDLPAYPKITFASPPNAAPVSRVYLINSSSLTTFDVALTVPPRSVLVGDMDALVTGSPRSVIALNGETKYGSWQLPRTPFKIDPAPYAVQGDNLLYMVTEPAGVPLVCTLDYRDTWAG